MFCSVYNKNGLNFLIELLGINYDQMIKLDLKVDGWINLWMAYFRDEGMSDTLSQKADSELSTTPSDEVSSRRSLTSPTEPRIPETFISRWAHTHTHTCSLSPSHFSPCIPLYYFLFPLCRHRKRTEALLRRVPGRLSDGHCHGNGLERSSPPVTVTVTGHFSPRELLRGNSCALDSPEHHRRTGHNANSNGNVTASISRHESLRRERERESPPIRQSPSVLHCGIPIQRSQTLNPHTMAQVCLWTVMKMGDSHKNMPLSKLEGKK